MAPKLCIDRILNMIAKIFGIEFWSQLRAHYFTPIFTKRAYFAGKEVSVFNYRRLPRLLKRANGTPGGRYTTEGWWNHLGWLGKSPAIYINFLAFCFIIFWIFPRNYGDVGKYFMESNCPHQGMNTIRNSNKELLSL